VEWCAHLRASRSYVEPQEIDLDLISSLVNAELARRQQIGTWRVAAIDALMVATHERDRDAFAIIRHEIEPRSNDIKLGSFVMAVADDSRDRNYSQETTAERMRATGFVGRVIDSSNAHGECYKIQFCDGFTAWFDPDELREVTV